MQARAAVADLCTRDERRAVIEARGRCGSARALRDVFVHLAVFIGARPEALYRSDDHLRVELLDVLPGEPHTVEGTGSEVLYEHVAVLHEPLENLLATLALGIDRDRALVVVQHREIQ